MDALDELHKEQRSTLNYFLEECGKRELSFKLVKVIDTVCVEVFPTDRKRGLIINKEDLDALEDIGKGMAINLKLSFVSVKEFKGSSNFSRPSAHFKF